MSFPLQVTFRHCEQSDAVEALIQEKADKLAEMHDRITQCRVVIEEPHRRHNKGNHFKVTIDLSVPGAELVVDRSPDKHTDNEDLYVAVRQAFDHMRRELEKLADKRRQAERAAAAGG